MRLDVHAKDVALLLRAKDDGAADVSRHPPLSSCLWAAELRPGSCPEAGLWSLSTLHAPKLSCQPPSSQASPQALKPAPKLSSQPNKLLRQLAVASLFFQQLSHHH
jgi:hypothetical protein